MAEVRSKETGVSKNHWRICGELSQMPLYCHSEERSDVRILRVAKAGAALGLFSSPLKRTAIYVTGFNSQDKSHQHRPRA